MVRAYSSCFMHAIVAQMKLPFFKIFSIFVHFCPNFQIYGPLLPFFWKITCMLFFSKIGPDGGLEKAIRKILLMKRWRKIIFLEKGSKKSKKSKGVSFVVTYHSSLNCLGSVIKDTGCPKKTLHNFIPV